MKKRLKFKCWKCERTYTLSREITEEQVLTVACPYCNADGVVDLGTYPRRKIQVFRNLSVLSQDDDLTFGTEPELPEVLPTQKPE
ncbi:MAG: hypothetical protein AB1817_02585 [Chloroflexota bacterium]